MKKISKICLIVAMIPSSIVLVVGAVLIVLSFLGGGDLYTLAFAMIGWIPIALLSVHAIIIIKKGLKEAWYLNIIYLVLSIFMFMFSNLAIWGLIQFFLPFFVA